MSADDALKDDLAAHKLLEVVRTHAAAKPAELVAAVAQQLAAHRMAYPYRPGPLLDKVEDAYLALIRPGYPDDELLKRLRAARDFARNLPPGKERAP
jgi:hypothetical protein